MRFLKLSVVSIFYCLRIKMNKTVVIKECFYFLMYIKINLQGLLAKIDTETESDAQNTTKKDSKEGEYVTLRG